HIKCVLLKLLIVLVLYMYNFEYLVNSIFFFFSSRRRHTISKRDWSSDVCSSDLHYLGHPLQNGAIICDSDSVFGKNKPEQEKERSEERRVGKESKSRKEE